LSISQIHVHEWGRRISKSEEVLDGKNTLAWSNIGAWVELFLESISWKGKLDEQKSNVSAGGLAQENDFGSA
jgi:hypothetical protein